MRASEVQRVFRSGRSSHGTRLVVFTAPGRGGVSAGASRKVGGAVQRNRAKRVLRAAWRETPVADRSSVDVVLVARERIRNAKTQDLVVELTRLLEGEARG